MTEARIIRTYHLLAGLYTLAASLIWGVNTLFLLDAGLSIGEVFVANAVFSAGMVVFEIPTGVVADTVGRRASYLLSVVVLGGTTLAYVAASGAGMSLGVFAAISLVMGLGFTFYSGALEAWLVDALASVGSDEELDHVFARAQQVTGVAMLVGTTAGGLLGQIDLAVPFVVRALLLVVVLVVAERTMRDLGFTPRPLEVSRIGEELVEQTRVGVAHGWEQPGLRRLIVAGTIRGAFVGWAFYAAQPYFLQLLDSDQVWIVGVITALMSLSTIAGNQLVEVLTRSCRRRSSLIIGGSTVATMGAVAMGVTDSFWVAVPSFLLVTGSMGVISPVRQAYVHHVTPSQHRATVISFDAMLGSVGGVGGQLSLGRLSDARGLSAGYVVGGAFTALSLPVLWSLRRLGGDADRIVPDGARGGTCAAQGLPRDTHTESHPRDVVVAP